MENELNKKKAFIIPSLDIIVFTNDDIITGSSGGDFGLGDNENGDDFPKTFWW